MRIALGVEYDGAPFEGWQSQPHGRTVQDVLEKGLAAIAGHPVRLGCAGRTDAGVHASGQVAHFDTHAVRPVNAWVRGVNRFLPSGVAVRWAREVSPEFHARFSALGRRYCYLLLDASVRPALQHGRVGWFHRPLNVDAMARAAGCLPGTHDFSSFRAAGCQARSPIKEMREVQVYRHGPVVVFEFAASAFLHHMVRNLVGALVYVGSGRRPEEWLGDVLVARDRSLAAPTFDPGGLYFTGVDYPEHWNLPSGDRMIAPLPLLMGASR